MPAIPSTNATLFSDTINDYKQQTADVLSSHAASTWNSTKHFVASHSRLLIAIAVVIAVLIIVVLAVIFAFSVVIRILGGIWALVTFIATSISAAVMHILGFAAGGIRAGSIAALAQAKLFGGYVPMGSIFSRLQSFGAR